MDTPQVITEKVYCHDCGGYGGYGYGGGMDPAWYMMANNNWNNNPILLFMLPVMMRMLYGDNWNDRNRGDYAEINARFNQLQGQLSDNHNTDIINEAVKGNTARIGELANTLNIDHRAIQSGICDLRAAIQAQGGDIRAGIQGLQGDVRFTGERVINASIMGDKDLQAAIKDCCCQNKELVQRMGYETQLGMKDQTYTINERLTGIANGITKGFSDIGYLMAQQKGELMNNQDRNAQRIVDTLNTHWKDEMSQALQTERFNNSQLKQNIYIRDLFEKNNGCGCGCGAA